MKKGLETAPPQHDRVHRPLRRNSNQVFFEVPINAPWGPGWQAVAYAGSYPEAWAKMQELYARRWCI